MRIKFKSAGLAEFLAFIQERHSIWYRRYVLKLAAPWTQDPILQRYKFCNVYRELDRGSEYVSSNIVNGAGDFSHFSQVLFGVMLYRLFNLPETYALLAKEGLVLKDKFFALKASRILLRLAESRPVFNDAYMTAGTGLHGPGAKIKDYCKTLQQLQGRASSLSQEVGGLTSMRDAWVAVRQIKWFGPFVAYQVVLDLYRTKFVNWVDCNNWVLIGPGAKEGLDHIINGSNLLQYTRAAWRPEKPMAARYVDDVYLAAVAQLVGEVNVGLKTPSYIWLRPFDIHDIEFCCCEFRKYINFKRAEADSTFRVRRRLFQGGV